MAKTPKAKKADKAPKTDKTDGDAAAPSAASEAPEKPETPEKPEEVVRETAYDWFQDDLIPPNWVASQADAGTRLTTPDGVFPLFAWLAAEGKEDALRRMMGQSGVDWSATIEFPRRTGSGHLIWDNPVEFPLGWFAGTDQMLREAGTPGPVKGMAFVNFLPDSVRESDFARIDLDSVEDHDVIQSIRQGDENFHDRPVLERIESLIRLFDAGRV